MEQSTLAALQKEVVTCTLCKGLAEQRIQTVFGDGNPQARILLVGEAPGADEDRTGIPFVGKAGQLLANILKACGLTRDDVYIANILKCRPHGNRDPLPDEAANCRKYLDGQIDFVDPEFIVCLGRVAATNLLGVDTTISSLRGRWHDYKERKVLCTYHPSYLLRAGQPAKQAMWEDLKFLLTAL
jgi:DNA polymerase